MSIGKLIGKIIIVPILFIIFVCVCIFLVIRHYHQKRHDRREDRLRAQYYRQQYQQQFMYPQQQGQQQQGVVRRGNPCWDVPKKNVSKQPSVTPFISSSASTDRPNEQTVQDSQKVIGVLLCEKSAIRQKLTQSIFHQPHWPNYDRSRLSDDGAISKLDAIAYIQHAICINAVCPGDVLGWSAQPEEIDDVILSLASS
ncbi:hypothetical protein ASPCADRAFT_8099 [Aspergillus carbonarius ITEM 5010]|uniref:Uncharacterized protein n=1 Tax=Aspergillus carbonarius (strain ITEM 5010) TaxID=602072 RepID=A0A1R3RF92_ASPC5|nr:hypothetical protein ASPCADRAFT_8099 [Aspergillus carbonarius ITEM 5010]